MDIIKEKWEEILYTVKLEHELTDVSFDTWLKPLKVHSFEKNGSANILYILIPAEQQPAFGYIKKKYALPLRVAIAEITGLDCSLEFILPEEAQKLEAKKATVTSNLNECIEKANLKQTSLYTLASRLGLNAQDFIRHFIETEQRRRSV